MLNNEQKNFLKNFFKVINSVRLGQPIVMYIEPTVNFSDPKECLIDYLEREQSEHGLTQDFKGVPEKYISKFIEVLIDIDFESDSGNNYQDDHERDHILDICDQREITLTIDSVKGLITISDNIMYTSESEGYEDTYDFDDFFGDDDTYDEDIIEYLNQLKGDGISTLTISFEGAGDQGAVSYRSNEGVNIPELISDYLADQLSNNYGGWELNDGSNGKYIIDLEQSTVSLSITFYESDSMYTTIRSQKII